MAGIEGLCEEAQKCMGRVGTLSDFTLLTADGSQFSASKALLAANSEVFGCVLTSSLLRMHDATRPTCMPH